MASQHILTAAEMRAAEDRVMAGGVSVEALMERAGSLAAEAIWHFAGSMETLVLCGPGNNGGDGYVIARHLMERGARVRVARLGEPRTPAAIAAAAAWTGPVGPLDSATPARLLVDALFGTGLTRGLAADVSGQLAGLAAAASLRVAVDLPSGADTDTGQLLSPVPTFDMTVSLGALKPSHLLQPAARHIGRLVVADIGLGTLSGPLSLAGRPTLPQPGPDSHKYSRGMVAVVSGLMPGAALLAAEAAQRAGAGYVALSGQVDVTGGALSLVHRNDQQILGDARLGAVVVGPGLGLDEAAAERLAAFLADGKPLVVDADALTLLARRGPAMRLPPNAVLTPHTGEFQRLFPDISGSRIDQVREAAARAGAVVLLKGADTVIGSPDGRVALTRPASNWLSTAGTGDVLAGIIGAQLARGMDVFEAAQAGCWLHAEAARRAGPAFIADDLPGHLAPLIGDFE